MAGLFTGVTHMVGRIGSQAWLTALIGAVLAGPGCLQSASGLAEITSPSTTSGGQLGGPHLDCVPRSLLFPPLGAGGSEALQVDCTNTGSDVAGQALQLTIAGTGSPVFTAQFGTSPGSPLTTSLTSGQQAGITVTYAPVTVSDDEASLSLTSNAGSVTIPLVGYGVSPNCQLQIPATNLDFGKVPVGTTRGPSGFSIENVGSGSCLIQAPITITNDPTHSFQVSSSDPSANGSQYVLSSAGTALSQVIIQVSFTPQTKGSLSANVGDFISLSGIGE